VMSEGSPETAYLNALDTQRDVFRDVLMVSKVKCLWASKRGISWR
jgi:hypothetical protein